MASLSYDTTKKRWRIQFKAPDGSRKSVSMRGSVKAEGKAQTYRGRLEELLSSAMTGTAIPRALASWVMDLPDETHQQLASAGLVEPRVASQLGPFLESWFKARQGQKESTLIVWGNSRRNLLEKSPFADIKSAMTTNKKRQRFISEEDSQKVLQACPNAEWRLLFALSRYGALRVPSEALNLTWDDIDWANDRIHVHAPKTEHHADGGDRVIPMFTELKPLLWDVWVQAPKGSVHVIEHDRNHKNLGTKLGRIIRLAGLKVWPKVWHNLRATRCTELERAFPGHVVTGWCGHSEGIAEAHYWMTTDSDFQQATSAKVTTTLSGGANVVQQAIANRVDGLQAVLCTNEKSQEIPGSATGCGDLPDCQMDDIGLEPTTSTMSTWRSNQLS